MKKLFTLAASMFMAAAATVPQTAVAADTAEAYKFQYFSEAGEPQTLSSLPYFVVGTTRVWVATEVRPSELALMEGDKITHLNVTAGIAPRNKRNPITKAWLFISEGYIDEPLFEQEIALGNTPNTEYGFALDTPYEIKDVTKPIYIGWYFTPPYVPSDYPADLYLSTDGIPANASNLMYATNNRWDFPVEKSWTKAGDKLGSLCISATVTGDNYPQDKAMVLTANYPIDSKTGTDNAYELKVRNAGANALTQVEIKTAIENGTEAAKTVTFDKPLASNGIATVKFEDLKFDKTGSPAVSSILTKANGAEVKDNFGAFVPTANVMVYDKGYDRSLVIEESTGTWCGWCPAGLVMIDYLKEHYGERFFPIAVHGGDPLAPSSYADFITYGVNGGYPTALVNRVVKYSPAGTEEDQVKANEEFIDNIYKEFTANPTYAKVNITGHMADADTFEVDAEVEYAMDMTVEHQLAFVVVENNIGPYTQDNYYWDGESGAMGGWENKTNHVKMNYDEVARIIVDYPSIPNSLPSQLTEGQTARYTARIPFKNAAGLDIVEGDEFDVIALITRASTGEVMNCCRVTFDKTAVDEIATGEPGNIRVEGRDIVCDGGDVEVYSLDGRRVSALGLPAGVYVARAGESTMKVIIK